MEGFPVVVPVQIRYADLDTYSHVNNAAYLSFLEVVRLAYFRRLGVTLDRLSTVVVRVEVDYRRPILLEQRVEVGCSTEKIGKSSYTMHYRIEADGELATEARSVLVHLADGRPAPIPSQLRAAVEHLEGR